MDRLRDPDRGGQCRRSGNAAQDDGDVAPDPHRHTLVGECVAQRSCHVVAQLHQRVSHEHTERPGETGEQRWHGVTLSGGDHFGAG
jgi:hypothetical protein